jgi:hypothetical protein
MGTTGAQGPQGNAGAAGATGATGTSTVYGDGSDGTTTGVCNISVNPTNWVTSPPATDIQCTNFTVMSGVTLTVPSGTLIHATGTVTISGTLTVQAGAAQGLYMMAPNTNSLSGGLALNAFTLRKLLNPGPFGGGNGGTFFLNGTSGLGGGSIVILAAGSISIGASGSINANGANGLEETDDEFGDGGGAGGIVILASKTSISNSGAINTTGGNGANAIIDETDPAGGGGGGLIHLLAPSGQLTGGTRNVAGGSAGTGSVAGYQTSFGGGALAGNGGAGPYFAPATAGTAGLSLSTTVVDPATLFVP